jgi:ATP-dependent Clp protease adaptor protein ClpS
VIEFLLLGGVPVGVWALERLRRRQYARAHAEFLGTLDEDVQVVLHVANHEAKQRDQPVTPLHMAYGLLQDEQIQALIGKVGGDPTKVEEAVLAALDAPAAGAYGTAPADTSALATLAFISQVARHAERRATTGDLWARLSRHPGVAAAFEAGGLPPHRLLFAMIHGGEPPALKLPAPMPGAVHVVLRNDDVTTFEFVIAMLRDVFELDAQTAHQMAMATHQDGRAVVGRFTPDIAASRIESARQKAREAGYPLWVGVEPC